MENLIYDDQGQTICFLERKSECIDALLCPMMKRQVLNTILKTLDVEANKDQTTEQLDRKV